MFCLRNMQSPRARWIVMCNVSYLQNTRPLLRAVPGSRSLVVLPHPVPSLHLRATTTSGALFSGCFQPLRREGGLSLTPFPAPGACFLPHNEHQLKTKASAPLCAKSKQGQDQLIFISRNESSTFFFEKRDFPTLNLGATAFPSNWGKQLLSLPPQPEHISER